MLLDKICAAILSYYISPDLSPVKEAHQFAFEKHSGQTRASGEPYLSHLEETALLVCQLKLDIPSVIAGLLHDILEDSDATKDFLIEKFGNQVADIVDGVTKLTRIEFESKEEKQAESFRKMLIAMGKDIRVILIKLCDRLHNMRTLHSLKEEKRIRIAEETKDIYAPLANRLGIHWLKSELEDLCLLHLRPEMYSLIDESFGKTTSERSSYILETCNQIVKSLEESGVSCSVAGRAKHYYSIWQKMEKNNLSFEEINDLIGFRIIVPTLRSCYETLGIIHSKWKPVPDRFKDYIAMPKPNMYQSLHTTVIGPKGQRIEVQIRTSEMNKVAEEGIAAHWKYKEGEEFNPSKSTSFNLQWVKDLVDTQAYLKNPDEFIQSVKSELFPEEVFIFTPKGDLIRLPFRSSPIDFAYSVHTDIGNSIIGAKVNGQMVSLDYLLQNGDTVEVLTSKSQHPTKDWLRYVVSSKAKQRIRSYLKNNERNNAISMGADILSKELRKVKLSLKKLEKEGRVAEVAQAVGFKAEQDLYVAIGYGKLSSPKIAARFLPEDSEYQKKLIKENSQIERIFLKAASASRKKVGIKVSGIDNVIVRFAKCCEPLPGDRIVGFITRGRGVTVHYADCANVHQSDALRKVDVDWDTEVKSVRKVKLTVHSQDQIGLLANMSHAITAQGANITGAQCKTTALGKAINQFEITVNDAKQLQKVKRAIEMVPGVTKVERITQLIKSVMLNENDDDD
jgi:GTP diphosphokinase / guanosine-3',5'-bis(diphosphate) 3'-diphosphatase